MSSKGEETKLNRDPDLDSPILLMKTVDDLYEIQITGALLVCRYI